eukprot:TRINITY_DN63863_c0_g1_i1.p1 TRINITY_DN63863_c0_g1~~TRINITY_DN63863_c0_g1_i1.p1  ORF type:complete len:288 (-),score=32.16 TRINITY_DN63863_c0_g1_i1:25-888(-)
MPTCAGKIKCRTVILAAFLCIVILLPTLTAIIVLRQAPHEDVGLPVSQQTSNDVGKKAPKVIPRDPNEDLRVFDFPPSLPEPSHLAPLNPSFLKWRSELLPIDRVHREGLVHTGSWISVTDPTGTVILLLKRGPMRFTCPNTWELVGEHSQRDEKPEQTARRAISEVLGEKVLESVSLISTLTKYPLYFLRHYGPKNGNKVDRQLTYLWRVQLNKPYREIELDMDLDDEVADHRWIELNALERWLERDGETLANSSSRDTAELDFCHSTIRLLMLETVRIMKDVQRN